MQRKQNTGSKATGSGDANGEDVQREAGLLPGDDRKDRRGEDPQPQQDHARPPAAPSITLNFLYQLIGQKEVERAVLIEQLQAVQREVAAIRTQLKPAGDAP